MNRRDLLLGTTGFPMDWQHAYWGADYPRLRAAKDRYDPDGFFFVHHGVGSEDGFTRLR